MAVGRLEVLLVSGRSLAGWTDLFSKTDAYVILSCSAQAHKSNTATNQGSNPVWNQKFEFEIDEGATELVLSVYDEDMLTSDDILGTVRIPLVGVFAAFEIQPTTYNVVKPDGAYSGEIKLSLSFTPKKLQE